jgi:peptidoglycan hydrolase CwlO-like protein
MYHSKFLILLTLIFGSFSLSVVGAETLKKASEKANADLTQSLEELAELRTGIAKIKVPLINDVAELEGNVRQ